MRTRGAAAAPPAAVGRLRAQAGAAAAPTPYHLRFRNFDQRTLDATEELFSSGIYGKPPAEQLEIMRTWVDKVSAVYGMRPPTLERMPPSRCSGSGCYWPGLHKIGIPKPSLMTLMHEARHAFQHHGIPMVQATHGDDRIEEDARAWSMSLFYTMRPERFKRLALERKIFHVEPEALQEFADEAEAAEHE